jgi:Trk-type K+ transport system membrane component
MRSRDVRWIRRLTYSAITLAALAGILMLATGSTGGGITVLVFAVLLALAFYRIERYLKSDVEVV